MKTIIDDLSACLEKFTKRKDKLEKLLDNQTMANDKSGIGYVPMNNNRYGNYIIKATSPNPPHVIAIIIVKIDIFLITVMLKGMYKMVLKVYR